MKPWPLVILLALISVFAQSPARAAQAEHSSQSTPQLDGGEAHQQAWFATRRKEHPELKQVAEGKYLLSDEESMPEATSSKDSWTLWKSADGQFEVAGTLESSDEAVPYWIQFTPGCAPQLSGSSGGRPPSDARRTPSTLLCEETNSKGAVLRTSHQEMNDTMEIFLPISIFWGGLTRGAEIHGDETAPFTMLAQGSETETFPISLNPVEASLKLLRRGKYPVAHSEMDAAEFELAARDPSAGPPDKPQGAGIPPGSQPPQPYAPMMKLWVSSNGILLSATPPEPEGSYVRLVEFKKFEDF